MSIFYGVCSIASGVMTAFVAYQGRDDQCDNAFERATLAGLLAALSVVALGAIVGGIVAVAVGMGVAR